MKTLRITGVPEHFNYPWVKVIESQPFITKGIRLEWIEESRGSGQMNKALRENQADLAILLTESFLNDFEAGNPSKIIGFHVNSPLIWGIHIHGKSKITSLKSLSTHDFLVSRMGSGSHLMGKVLAERENWEMESLSFRIVDNLPGALKAMTPNKPELFLWEKYTTKPWVDSLELKRIDEIPSPWPCFVMAASNLSQIEFGDILIELRDLVYNYAQKLQRNPSTAEEISIHYDLKKEDVEEWMNQTNWATSAEISKSILENAVKKMIELGILKSEIAPQDFLVTEKITFVD